MRTRDDSRVSERHLLPLLRDVAHAAAMRLKDWDGTLRLARQARVLGVLANRLRADAGLWQGLPEPVRGQLKGAINYAAYRAQLVRMELAALDEALPAQFRVVALKGAAYLLQDLPNALGRAPNDVDLLVAREDIDEVEAALNAAGWVAEVKSDYDQRYYREWSHELPPLRKPGHALELDLHHTIAPVTSRTRANDSLLFADLSIIEASRFRVLDPCDQIIHAAVHLFQDSELDGRLREVVDIDALVRAHLHTDADWTRLAARAGMHGATRVLWYGLHYARSWLATQVPDEVLQARPSGSSRRLMDWIVSRSMLPALPDAPPDASRRLAFSLGRLRYHWLRMPPGLLLRHLAHKSWHSLLTSRSASPR
jgi:hypothetical protein